MAAQKVLQEIKSLEHWINLWKEVDKKSNETRDIIELAAMEEDESFYDDIRKDLVPDAEPFQILEVAI